MNEPIRNENIFRSVDVPALAKELQTKIQGEVRFDDGSLSFVCHRWLQIIDKPR